MVDTLMHVLLGANLESLRWLFRGGPMMWGRVCRQLRQTADAPHDLPEITLREILAGREPVVTLPVTGYRHGMLPPEQLVTVLAILKAEQPKEVLEIGTFKGQTTRMMAEALDDVIVHTVDLPPDFSADADAHRELPKNDFHLIAEGRSAVGQEFSGLPCASRIRQPFGDSTTWDFAQAGSPTFFFIDGSHTYEYCRNDSEKCLALQKGPAVFLWHDVDGHHPGVVKMLMEWRAMGRDVRRIMYMPIGYWKSPGV